MRIRASLPALPDRRVSPPYRCAGHVGRRRRADAVWCRTSARTTSTTTSSSGTSTRRTTSRSTTTPSSKQHLERIAGYAESAYQQISADLKHDLLVQGAADPVQDAQRVRAGERRPGRRPGRRRRVRRAGPPAHASLPIDDPPDQLYGLIVHELTHQFEFDIIPQGLIRRSVPLWVNEGLSDYERGQWDAARPDDGPRRGGRRHRAEDDRARRLRQRRQRRRARSTTSATRCSSSSRRSSARKASGSSCSRCARASSAAARTPTKKRCR